MCPIYLPRLRLLSLLYLCLIYLLYLLPFRCIVPIPRLSTPIVFSRFAILMLVCLLYLLLFASVVHIFGLSAFFVLVVILIPRKQKLLELNQKEKKLISKNLILAFISLFLSIKPLLLFLTRYIGQKQLFNKVFDINFWILAKNQFGKEVNLSFSSY